MNEINTVKIQKRIYNNKIAKGFNITDIPQEFCLLYGEVGEAFEAWRRQKNDFGEELADVAIYLLGIAELCKIDLGNEICKKMDIIEKRIYHMVNGALVKDKD